VAAYSPPALQPGQVRVRIEAAPINPADLNTIEGTYGVKLELPAVPGIEGCGVIEQSAAEGFAAGERVVFLERAATWSSHTVVPASCLFKVPGGIDPLQAAMLKVNPATAWRLLHGFAPLKAGDWIVQNLGNSAVGRCVIQLARDMGVKSISFVRDIAQAAALKQLGADEVFVDDEAGQAAATEMMGGANAALAFNAVGGDSALRLMKLLAQSGTHITYGAMGRKPITLPNGLLIFRDIRVVGLWVTQWLQQAPAAEVHAVYQDLAQRVAAGRLVQPVDSTHDLADFAAALARLDAPDRAGKVLLAP
ncbi:MAG TPA: 2-enoyl thioester reductase domain-containing protein, partial [Luteolibacter sp.]|nr:2-enoyl thioester reductase domain-containing protein [Luteolibacter sp.]